MAAIFYTTKSITRFSGIIVNAANADLRAGAGVCGAIHAAAGPDLEVECKEIRYKIRKKKIPTGSAVITNGHVCQASWIIHAVGPIYSQYEPHEAVRLLAKTYVSCMKFLCGVDEQIVFPAISCGVYGFPIPLACEVAVNTLKYCIYSMSYAADTRIVLTAFDPVVKADYEKLGVPELY
jgi:O-acetyl-ADP-ribose deacetylase (regulator of RNase III)